IGGPVDVTGMGIDYTEPRPIGTERIDCCFVNEKGCALELRDPGSGRRMRVSTDQPGLSLYSGESLPRPRSGLCIQATAWPDAPNRPGYPSARLDPTDTYLNRTRYEFLLA